MVLLHVRQFSFPLTIRLDVYQFLWVSDNAFAVYGVDFIWGPRWVASANFLESWNMGNLNMVQIRLTFLDGNSVRVTSFSTFLLYSLDLVH